MDDFLFVTFGELLFVATIIAVATAPAWGAWLITRFVIGRGGRLDIR